MNEPDDASSLAIGTIAPLPIEIAFLVEAGVPVEDLRFVADRAESWNVHADEAAIGLELIGEEAFYRALARHLRLPFLPAQARPLPHAPGMPEGDILLLPLDASQGGPRFALAPQGDRLRQLLARPRGSLDGAAIATPRRLRALARQARRPALRHHLSHALPDALPHLSARDGFSAAQAGVLLCSWCALCFGLAYDAGRTGDILMALLLPLFLGLVVLRLAGLLDTAPVRLKPGGAFQIPDAELPVYTVAVALYRERDVLPQLVRALRSIDYPPAKLDMKILLEEEDTQTRAALIAADLPPFVDLVVVPAGFPRTKPRALNAALLEARGEFLVIYDAEDVPDPLQLRHAVARFRRLSPEHACLQARLVIDNTADSWLATLFTMEYAHLFDVFNPALVINGLPVPLGGTSNHFRVDALRHAMGWDAWNVTEDADLGLRLAQLGYRVGDLPSSTLEEAPATLPAWMRQRRRWVMGWMQTCMAHARHPLRSLMHMGAPTFCAAIVLSLAPVLAMLGYPFFFLGSIWLVVSGAWPHPDQLALNALAFTVFAAGIVSMIVPPLKALRLRGLMHLAPYVVLLPVYYGLVSVAAWWALVDFFRKPFHWHKTTHGLARTSRTGALTIADPENARDHSRESHSRATTSGGRFRSSVFTKRPLRSIR
jgi:cellulose synthase/poly-beta-1,6-N-acetylglucosamine synthase-like glycosyltransferase